MSTLRFSVPEDPDVASSPHVWRPRYASATPSIYARDTTMEAGGTSWYVFCCHVSTNETGLNVCFCARLCTPCDEGHYLGMSSSRSMRSGSEITIAEGSVHSCRGDCHWMPLVRPPCRTVHSSSPVALTARLYLLPQGAVARPGGLSGSRDVRSTTLAHRGRAREDRHAFLHVWLWQKVHHLLAFFHL